MPFVGSAFGNFGGGDPTDECFGYVELLLHFDGSNGSTTFADSSSNARTVTAVANAQLTTADYKFGTASGLFDGTGDQLNCGTGIDFTGDVCIEFWINFDSNTRVGEIICAMEGGTSGAQTLFYVVKITDGSSCGIGFACMGVQLNDATFPMTAGTWYHCAVTMEGNDCRLFIGGVKVAENLSFTTVRPASSRAFLVGREPAHGNDFDGKLDDLRVTVGCARYTADFTPPTAAFPNS